MYATAFIDGILATLLTELFILVALAIASAWKAVNKKK